MTMLADKMTWNLPMPKLTLIIFLLIPWISCANNFQHSGLKMRKKVQLNNKYMQCYLHTSVQCAWPKFSHPSGNWQNLEII